MRIALSTAVVLATVVTVLVAVRQFGEVRRLEADVWREMRRRDALERQIREAEAELATLLSPRSLLEELDARLAERDAEERP